MKHVYCCYVASVVSDSVRPHRWQPTRLPHPWDSPGKNTGVGCHFLLQCMKVKSESEVAQSCPTLRDPKEQTSFNFAAAVTVHSDFGSQENKICHCFHFSPSICHEVMGPESAEKTTAPHCSTLAWKIPWMEEPGRLQSMGSLRVGHD